jgi:hypothetical protein
MPSSTSARASSSAWAALGIAGAPVLLLLELTVAYAIIPWTCEWKLPVAFHALIGGTLLIALAIAGLSWCHLAPAESRRERFLGVLSIAISALVTLVVAVQWLTALVVPQCVSSL